MRWLLRPPLVLGWFDALPYRLGATKRDEELVRAERLKYWNVTAPVRTPRAQLYGFLTGLILWLLVTFVGMMPLLGWLVRLGVPVPGFIFGFVLLLPVVMLAYLGVLIPMAPIRSRSIAWVWALSWPVEMLIALLVGAVSWLVW